MTLSGDGGRPSRRSGAEARAGRTEVRYSGGLAGGSRRRCSRHELAVGADGRCVLCRRADSAAAEETGRTHATVGRALALVAAVVVLAVGGLLVLRTRRSSPEPARPVAVVSEGEANEPDPEEATEQSEPQRSSDRRVSRGPPREEPVPWDGAAPSAVADGLTANDGEALAAATDAAPAATDQVPSPSRAELEAALRATPITLYATDWCPVCTKARAFLASNRLVWREIDVERVSNGWNTVERLAGKRSVPVIVVDGEVLRSGLDQTRVMQAVVRSMERRLGVQGIQLKQL